MVFIVFDSAWNAWQWRDWMDLCESKQQRIFRWNAKMHSETCDFKVAIRIYPGVEPEFARPGFTSLISWRQPTLFAMLVDPTTHGAQCRSWKSKHSTTSAECDCTLMIGHHPRPWSDKSNQSPNLPVWMMRCSWNFSEREQSLLCWCATGRGRMEVDTGCFWSEAAASIVDEIEHD